MPAEPEPVAVEPDLAALEPTLDPVELAAPLPEPAAEMASLPVVTPPAQVTRFASADAATDPAIELRALTESGIAELPAESPVDLLAGTMPPDAEAQDALAALEPTPAETEAPPAAPLEAAALTFEAPQASDDGSAWTSALLEASEGAPEPIEGLSPAPSEAVEPLPPEPAEIAPEPLEAAPRRSLAERIDAAVEAEGAVEAEEGLPAGEAEPGESDGWGAMPVAAEPPLEDLGATPLDDADPAAELGLVDAAPIELSSADVILLEPESDAGAEPPPEAAPGLEAELGGEPADRVPLAELHEFVGEQPVDPRALAFDDQGEEPTFSPEDLQATEAELAAQSQTFQPGELGPPPELEPEPAPPPPAAPRIVVPRPPSAAPARPGPGAVPPPAPSAPPAPRTPTFVPPPEPPPAPPRTFAAAAQARPATPPSPPAAAYVMGEDGRRMPALSVARPEPPQLAHQFGNSGPFARNRTALLAEASLDVMEGADGLVPLVPEPLVPEPPPPPPATDVATGAEVFGGSYLSPTFVEGEHRVVLHTLEGQVRRGTVKDIDLLDPVIRLAQPGRPPEAIAAERVKAIFFMQEPGTPPPPSAGRRIRVGFADGRQIVGFSEDVDGGEQGFFLVPADTRTHTARIYVFRAGVQSISAA